MAFTAFALSLLLLFYLSINTNKKSAPQNQAVSNVSSGLPIRLAIPAINVNANIQQVGVTPKGEMDVPNNSIDVGWFKLGSRPGEKGSAVIDGHFNDKNGEAGVFFNLYKLKKGNKLYIKDDKGIITTFIVRESRIYNTGYAEEVFSSNDNAHLNLVTCDGVWDGTKKSYTKRLVIFADIVR
jgi:LPXTG-site transpeptidase (sortase) family protein